jgi:CelD/BcsL family acetyltransferase involved in cellulose biosynthesis
MSWLGWDELEEAAGEVDHLAARTPGIDGFCSSTMWILPAREAFTPQAEPAVLRTGEGVAVLMTLTLAGGVRAAFPLEASWALASPFLGPEPGAVVEAFFAAIRVRRRIQAVIASGLPEDGAALAALARLSRRALHPAAPPTERVVASLEGGVEGFLARRSPKMRASLRRARRAAAQRGIGYERLVRFTPDEVAAVAERIFAVEDRSWKTVEGGGMAPGPMRDFYRHMLPRLARRGALRVVFVTRDGADLAFCFGGIFSSMGVPTYRGLQASFDDRFARESPGLLAHLEMIHLVAEEGVSGYDLGTDMEYKRRWGEPGLRTVSVVAVV